MPSSLPLPRFPSIKFEGSPVKVGARAPLSLQGALNPGGLQLPAQPYPVLGPTCSWSWSFLFPFFQLNDLLRIARKIPTFLPYNENKEISHGHGDKNSFVSARANGFKRSGDKGIFQRSEKFRRSGRKGEEAL